MDSQSIATAIYGWMDQSTRPWSHIPASLPSTATAAFEGREAVCTTLLALIRKIGTIPDWRAQDLTGRVFHSAIWLGVFKLSDGFLSSILLLLPSLLQYIILYNILAISPNSTFNSINNPSNPFILFCSLYHNKDGPRRPPRLQRGVHASPRPQLPRPPARATLPRNASTSPQSSFTNHQNPKLKNSY